MSPLTLVLAAAAWALSGDPGLSSRRPRKSRGGACFRTLYDRS